MASIDLTFYDGDQFPKEYRHDAFASEHGSWNRARRTGYKVIRVPMKDGKATGEFEDFLVGFVTKEGNVWGRPAGVASPSIVVICRPAAAVTGVTHERVAWPSRCTVQAPHSAMPQPNLVPVSCR
jgi:hypothetical protein